MRTEQVETLQKIKKVEEIIKNLDRTAFDTLVEIHIDIILTELKWLKECING